MPSLLQILNEIDAEGECFINVALDPVPTGWNTKVENPGDKKLTKKEREYNTELARHQGGAPSYVNVAQVARTDSVPYVYSGGPGSGRHAYAVVGYKGGVYSKDHASKEAAKEALAAKKAQLNFGRAGGVWKGTDKPDKLVVFKHEIGESNSSIFSRYKKQLYGSVEKKKVK